MTLLLSSVPFDNGKSGISVYAREVARALIAQGVAVDLVAEPDFAERDMGEVVVRAPCWARKPVPSMLWHLCVLPFIIRKRRRDYDGFLICAANRRVCAFYPLPTLATVHDLANFHIPGKYSRSRMFYLAHVLPFFAKRARRLLAVSASTKADMVKFWHCADDDVAVYYNGIPALSAPALAANPAAGGTILYISRLEHPGKNHVRLIEAYGALDPETARKHPLVLAGADWKDADAIHAAASASPNAAHIRFTGFVDDVEVLWKECAFYVFPSLFEGFGLTLAEAMARGIPCAASNNGSLGEIAGDAAVTFDPESAQDIARAIKELVGEDAAARAARIARGIERAAMFSWAAHARGVVKEFEAMCPPKDAAKLFGISVSTLDMQASAARIIEIAKSRPAKFVATLNVDFVSNAVPCGPFKGNEELWGNLKRADFDTADGMPSVLLANMTGGGIRERVTGADLVPELCRRCAAENLKVYVLGGDEAAVKEAFARIGTDVLAGCDSSFIDLSRDQPEIVERINAAKADILFVALGNPKQELWMGRNISRLDVGVAIGIGGTFNFMAGKVKRAPVWMQKCGMEWIYRIVQEPGRLWRRYAYGLVKYACLAVKTLAGGFR